MKNKLSFSKEAKNLKLDTCEHCEGNKYNVLGVRRNSETLNF